ncbi:BMP family ABC transporter substrate-binding protein [Cohnella ginsengisoli]|uniref:BMP family ABC transporter substrate-binding protein n=1 Tax=Cohnella ginsengisoli TaxID=425004 RepID=A0A9X4KD78_9BACL|nr:BMP family ABC transporter substrate-binding protein [Cohnella ginsengisoli]MDG0789833.1 BMP family ABC transporter substrate-binding protein [Cohnella ginsengisoli]
MKKSTMKPLSLMLVAMLAMLLVLSGCGSKNNNSEGGSSASASASASESASPSASASESASPSASASASESAAPADGKGKKIGMVTDLGGVNDKSFNQQAWESLQKIAKDTGAETKYQESKKDSDYIPLLTKFVKDGYDLTWGIGFLFADAATTVASANPESKLALIDTTPTKELPNVESVLFKENEGSFLVGVVAGLTTKTNKIGFVGGMELPVIKKFEAGFKAGVAAVNPNATIEVNYVGDFSKPDQGKLAAATMYDGGADIIFHAAGGSGNGVFNEAKDRFKAGKKVWVIGVDKDQSIEFGNDVTLTSMVKKVDEAVYRVSNDLLAGNFHGGQTVELGLAEGGVGLPVENPNVSKEILDKVEDYKNKIISGEIKVPTE